MKIYIDGKQLDTYAKSVSVKKTNNLWKFGKAEFERTQAISVPATNNNKALLDFADEFRTQSSVARGYVDCLTELDGVVKPARLYVNGYSDGEFSVILIFGKELRSLDVKVSDVLGEYVDINKLVGLDNSFNELSMYDIEGNVIKRFCVSFNYLMQLIKDKGIDVIDLDAFKFTSLAYAVDYNSTNVDEVGIDKAVGLTRVYGTKSTSPTNKNVLYTYTFDYANLNAYRSKTAYTVKMSIAMDGASVYAEYYAAIEYFAFPFDVILRFGDNCSDYAVGFVGSGTTYIDAFAKLFGHYRADGWNEVYNDLSNTDLRIPSGTKFAILRYGDFYDGMVNHPSIPGAFLSVQGLFYADYGGTSNSFPNITIKLPVFNYKFIPDVTVYQLLQTLAAYKQRMLYFDGTKYTIASVSDISSGGVHVCKDVVAGGYSLTDKAFDYAQHNYVYYKSGGNVLDYTTNNLHLDEAKTLLKIPFDGGYYAGSGDTIFKPAEGFPAIGSVQRKYFRFNQVAKIGGFEGFLQKTRQVKVKFRMSYLDFIGIKELDNFEYKGAPLQWSSLQWADGWCTATLQTLQ